MHILIVTAHPDPRSYTHAAIARLVAGLEANPGTTHEIVDLAAEGFDPRFTATDHDHFKGRAEHGEDILFEQRRIDRADVLVLVFPVYWWSMPAVMKGWIDRVFTSGWAYIDDPETGTTRLLGRLKGQVVAIGGADRRTYERRNYLDCLNTQIVQGIFGYCGIHAAGLDLLLPLDAGSEAEGLQRAFQIGQRLSGETS
ncbi:MULTISPECIES: NAD(P)H-dependent oxidoreductase [unclassified Aureimonas]|uniref:NAD(P)H-dependent oxidoreductase n=1 Tax=unclassified Aureimonas TaxID=2615206 RepID=UPI0007020494|nr:MULTISPECIES: NAD(P)H-dependent oxidoreductase [unclassified Aureimonas]KQT63960.1 NAD(P)H dehydrogenase [Aureimonas sp. Leaf427]KQT81153.1 NAD(P)H dehydrogenase [Aureimonas sp. Leaf460]